MSGRHSFTAAMEAAGGGAFVNVPFDVEKEFGKKRVKVKAEIDGQPYRGSLVRMGGESHMLIVLKEIRQKIGKGPGDEVQVAVEEDTEPRVVEVPDDLKTALAEAPPAAEFLQTLSYSNQREYVLWVEGAKREQTRADRVARSVEMLSQGKKNPQDRAPR